MSDLGCFVIQAIEVHSEGSSYRKVCYPWLNQAGERDLTAGFAATPNRGLAPQSWIDLHRQTRSHTICAVLAEFHPALPRIEADVVQLQDGHVKVDIGTDEYPLPSTLGATVVLPDAKWEPGHWSSLDPTAGRRAFQRMTQNSRTFTPISFRVPIWQLPFAVDDDLGSFKEPAVEMPVREHLPHCRLVNRAKHEHDRVFPGRSTAYNVNG